MTQPKPTGILRDNILRLAWRKLGKLPTGAGVCHAQKPSQTTQTKERNVKDSKTRQKNVEPLQKTTPQVRCERRVSFGNPAGGVSISPKEHYLFQARMQAQPISVSAKHPRCGCGSFLLLSRPHILDLNSGRTTDGHKMAQRGDRLGDVRSGSSLHGSPLKRKFGCPTSCIQLPTSECFATTGRPSRASFAALGAPALWPWAIEHDILQLQVLRLLLQL